MPDAIVPDPEDFADRLESAGIDRESFSLRDFDAWDKWSDNHPEWASYSDMLMSHEAIAGMWAVGIDPDASWDGLLIGADGDDWWVEITTDDGYTYTIPIGDGYDIAWDYYDYANHNDIDIEKDIDTGSTED